MNDSKRSRRYFILILLFLTPLGFYTKFYRGPGAVWVADSLGGFFYEVFWCLLIAIITPRLKPMAISGGVFLVTSALEFLQLWHPPFLTAIRRTFIGRTLIGTSFTWSDFPYYLGGCLAGYLILKLINNRHSGKKATPNQPVTTDKNRI